MPILNSFSTHSGIGLTGNTAIGGAIPIWTDIEVARRFSYPGGFSILNPPDAQALIPGGTPYEVNEAARTAKICYRFEVYEAASNSATAIKLVKDASVYNLLQVGMVLMKMPVSLTGTATAHTITAIDTSHADYDEITLNTTLGVALVAGDILAEADGDGSGRSLEAVADGLSYADRFIEKDELGYSTSVVYEGTILNRRIRKIADIEKDKLNRILFSESK